MTTIRKATAAIVSGLLIAVSGTAGWSASNNDSGTAVTQKAAEPAVSAQLETVLPMLKNPEHHEASKNCKAPGLYSSHDVVGDPEACFMGRINAQTPAGLGGTI
jgi:hypothetical protein